MSWEHFEVKFSGECQLQHMVETETFNATYEMGILTTGRQRVFWGYHQIVIELPDGRVVGKSKGYSGSYSFALDNCNEALREAKLRLLVAGNAPTYSESAMSSGSGMGYVVGRQSAVGIMATWPGA